MRGGLRLFGQRVVDVVKMETEYIEVLARVQKEDGSFISPFFEGCGADTLQTAKFVLDRVRGYMKENGCRFGVNVELADLMDTDGYDSFLRWVNDFSEDKSRLVLEIVEGYCPDDGKEKLLEERIGELKRLGISIALDDFGIKYSNFSRLAYIDADYIKLDISIVKSICSLRNGKLRNFISSIGEFDHRVKIIVEGVENEREFYDFLSLGFRYFQGYLFEKPAIIDRNYLQNGFSMKYKKILPIRSANV